MNAQGTRIVNVDSKGRIAIPSKFRDTLLDSCGGRVVLTAHGEDNCLTLYPEAQWKKVAAIYKRFPAGTRVARDMVRRVIGQAEDMVIDTSGRLLLPSHMRDSAGIEKKLAIVGMGNHLELHAESSWLISTQEPVSAEDANQLTDLYAEIAALNEESSEAEADDE